MLARSVIPVAIAALLASQIPALLDWTDAPVPAEIPSQTAKPASFPAGSAIVRPDALGHFTAVFRINGKPVEGMIDTGASLVAISEGTARRLGLAGDRLRFTHTVSTANGPTKAAHVVLDRMELDGIRVHRVEAFVLREDALSSTLIGMSFLNKLTSFAVEDGALKLTK